MSEMARRFAVDTVWTPEKVEVLKAMITAGKSFTEMARALNVTRGAVASKAHRLDLSTHSLWTEEAVKLLTELWSNSDVSAAHIASRLTYKFGAVFSRNAVLGKIHRLKLPPRRQAYPPKQRRVSTLRRTKSEMPTAKATRPRPEAVILDSEIPFHQRKSLLELTSKTCRWPVGEPGVDLFFCGAEPIEGKPYCACHCQIAYTQPQKRNQAPSKAAPRSVISTIIPSRKVAA